MARMIPGHRSTARRGWRYITPAKGHRAADVALEAARDRSYCLCCFSAYTFPTGDLLAWWVVVRGGSCIGHQHPTSVASCDILRWIPYEWAETVIEQDQAGAC